MTETEAIDTLLGKRQSYQYLLSCGWCGGTHTIPVGYIPFAGIDSWSILDCESLPSENPILPRRFNWETRKWQFDQPVL